MHLVSQKCISILVLSLILLVNANKKKRVHTYGASCSGPSPSDKEGCDERKAFHFDVETKHCREVVVKACVFSGNLFPTGHACKRRCMSKKAQKKVKGKKEKKATKVKKDKKAMKVKKDKKVKKVKKAGKNKKVLKKPKITLKQAFNGQQDPVECMEMPGDLKRYWGEMNALQQLSEEQENLPEICRPILNTGFCRMLGCRFGYDAELDECVKFMFGGCQTNDNNWNNFGSKAECESACIYYNY